MIYSLPTLALVPLIALAAGLVIGLVLAPTASAGAIVGIALTTTALGTIMPVLRDSGQQHPPLDPAPKLR